MRVPRLRGSDVIILSVVVWVGSFLLILNLRTRGLLPLPGDILVIIQTVIVLEAGNQFWGRRIDAPQEDKGWTWRDCFRPGNTKQSIVVGISVGVAMAAYQLLGKVW